MTAVRPESSEPAAIDPDSFRAAMGQFVTGVTVATADGPDGPVGITVNSLTSVSLSPPLILFCLDRGARTRPVFEAAPGFAVNMLTADQQSVSRRFARNPADWDGLEVRTGTSGAPIIAGALAAMDCLTEAIHDGGDHIILVGRVVGVERADGDPAPLVYHRGGYRRLAE
ncbi:MAG: flavin reductase family protein [Azospirillaceae bacterium]